MEQHKQKREAEPEQYHFIRNNTILIRSKTTVYCKEQGSVAVFSKLIVLSYRLNVIMCVLYN